MNKEKELYDRILSVMNKNIDSHFDTVMSDSDNTGEVLERFKEYKQYLDEIDRVLPENKKETNKLRKKICRYCDRLNDKSSCIIV